MNEDLTKHFARQITLDEIAKEISRELVTRKRVYVRWINDGKISQEVADYRCLVLEALLRKLCSEQTANDPQKNLFDTPRE